MGANRSKLLDGVKSNIRHKLTEMSIDDLLDETSLQKEFTNSNFKEFIREDLIDEEEEEVSLLRYLELFKSDMMLNFTNSYIGKEIPNMATNYVYDKFTSDYNNSYHNEFLTKVAQTTNFLLSIFLNLAKTETQKEEVVNLLSNLQKDLSNDEVAQQKFFTLFSILSNLKKMVEIEKNYEEFFKILETYTKFLNGFVADSKFTIYLIKDHVTELSDSIIKNIIQNKGLHDDSLKKKGIISLLKLGVCFKIVDLHLEFIENLIKYEGDGNGSFDVKEELSTLIEEVFNFSLGVTWDKISLSHRTNFTVKYNQNVDYSDESSYATDGVYLYVHSIGLGLVKIGTGKRNTIEGKVYNHNPNFYNTVEGSLAYSCGKLYFRSVQTAPHPFVIVNTSDLLTVKNEKNIPKSFSEDDKSHLFCEKERSPANLSYSLPGFELIDAKRAAGRSKIFSEGRYLYVISNVGELKNLDVLYKDVFPNNTLISVDVYDPLNDCAYVSSFPIKDYKHLLAEKESEFVTEFMSKDIVTDGRVIHFFTKNMVTYNIITGTISECDQVSDERQENYILDVYNSVVWGFSREANDEQKLLTIGSVKINGLNVKPNICVGKYENTLSNRTFNLVNKLDTIYDSNNNQVARKEKEEKVYDFFFKEKKSIKKITPIELIVNKNDIISILLNILSDGAKFSLNYSGLNSTDIISHVYFKHILNLSTVTMEKLVNLQRHFMDLFVIHSEHQYEFQHFILSSLFKLISTNLKQVEFLKFDKFKEFNNDFGYVKEVIQNSIFLISEFNLQGDHYKGLTTDLIFGAFDIVQNYSNLFSIEYPDFELFINLIIKKNDNLLDLKSVAINSISTSGKKIYNTCNLEKISECLNNLMLRNDKIIFEIIDKYSDIVVNNNIEVSGQEDKENNLAKKFENLNLDSEFEKQFENFFTPLLKLTFSSYLELSSCKDETEKIEKSNVFNNYLDILEGQFRQFYNHILNILATFDEKISSIKFTNLKDYNLFVSKISNLLKSSSYTYRFFYSSVGLLNLLIKDPKVIFKTWHYFYDILVALDKSIGANKNIFFNLVTLSKELKVEGSEPEEAFDFILETSHPATKPIDIEKKFTFEKPSSLYINFDAMSFKDSNTEFTINLEKFKADSTTISEKFTSGFTNLEYTDIKSFSFIYKSSTSSNYGVKVHFRNYVEYSHYLQNLQILNTSIITNSIKTFFFFNYSKSDGSQKELEEMLQSKLFEGGINELLDLETSSEDYKSFIYTLKRSSSFKDFEKKLSNEGEEFNESDMPPFDIDEFIYKENISVEKLIMYFQKSLRPRFPWIGIGGENADKIVRATFAVVVKQERLYEMITGVVTKIFDIEEINHNTDSSLTIKELGEIENFEYLLLIWTEISRLRQWYQEQVKDLAEVNSNDFDKQNENFVNSVCDKCRFLFTINAPQRKKTAKKTKLNFLQIFAKSQVLSTVRIENDSVKANAIKFKKNLMFGKIDEGKSETENVKKITSSVTGCVKLTKISIEELKKAMREMNTRAKFREISLSLINSLLLEIESDDTKLFIMKQIIHTLRKTSGKKLISIDDEVKSASPDLLSKIQSKFHNLIQIIFGNLLKSKTIFHITEYLECLIWNLRARNQKVLIEVNLFENLFLQSPNELIKTVWNKVSKLKMNPYHKNKNVFKFNHKSLGFALLEFFNIYASMIAGRIIDETHSESEDANEGKLGLMKKKSSVFDNSYEQLLENITQIILNKMKEYINNYNELNSNIGKYSEFLANGKAEEEFPTVYFDENFLNLFLLLVYKFNVNQSNLMLKHMKDPEFLVSLLILLKYTSNKNKFSIVNILKVYLINLTEEDLHNLVFFLNKNEIVGDSKSNKSKYIGLENKEEEDPKKVLILYLLNLIYSLRKGLFTKEISMSSEYEESAYLVNLVKFLSCDDKWKSSCEELFIEHLSTLNVNLLDDEKETTYNLNLISPILSVLNGDCEDLHYGSYIYVKFSKSNTKSILQMFKDKFEELNTCTTGYVLGFSENEVKLNDLKTETEVKNFINNELHYSRKANDKYALIISINTEMYQKNKLKNNDVDIQMKELNDVILYPEIEIKISNGKIVKLLLEKESDILNLLNENKKNDKSAKFITSFIHIQLLKVINSIFKSDNLISEENIEYIKTFFSLERLRPLISELSANNYSNLKVNQYEFINKLKLFLNTKTELKLELTDRIVKERTPIKVNFLRLLRSLRIFKGDSTNGKVFKIINSNCTIDSDSFLKINTFKLVKLLKVKKYLNTLIYCKDAEADTIEKINKIDDINFALIFVKADLANVKANVIHPYIVVDTDHESLERLIAKLDGHEGLEGENINTSQEISDFKLIEKIDFEKFKVKSEDVDNARTKVIKSADEGTEMKIKYSNPFELNIPEFVSNTLKKINEPVTKLDNNSLGLILNKLIKGYIRFFLIHILSHNPQFITQENYSFITEQFKIVYFDACQYFTLTTFNYSRFSFINNLLKQLVEKEKECDTKFLVVKVSTKMFSAYTEISESDFKTNVQSELVEFYFESEFNMLSSNENISTENLLAFNIKILKITLITLNYETNSFNRYLIKLKELFEMYLNCKNKDSDIKKFDEEILQLKKEGLDCLIIYLIDSLEVEKNKYTSRTKLIFSFVWELIKSVQDTYKKLYNEDKSYSIEDIPKNGKLANALSKVNVLYYKSKDKELRNNSLLSLEDIKQKLTNTLEIPISPYIFEKTLNFSKNKSHKLDPSNTETKNKMILIAEKSSSTGTFKINVMVADDENLSINANSSDHMLIVNKEHCTSELFMCGYNEGFRLGNDTLNDYQYCYIPYKSMIDDNVRIKKVINGYQCTFAATYDNKIYVAGVSTNSGLDEQSKTFTLENKWNTILKKGEKFIDMAHNENSGFVFATDKAIYVSGYNCNNLFGEVCSSNTYTTEITKMNISFKASKIVEVTLGYGNLAVRLDDGSVYGCGCNCSLELNFESTSAITSLTKLDLGGLKCEKVSCGYMSTLLLMRERNGKVKLYSMGSCDYGQNGQSSNPDKRFKKCSGTEDIEWRHIKAGYTSSLGITSDNKLYTWGYNGYYNLSHGDSNYRYVPTLVEFFSDKLVLDADINERNIVVKCLENEVVKIFTAGYNGYGCMGIGDTIESYNSRPLEVTKMSGFYVQKVTVSGVAMATNFIVSNLNAVSNPFEFKCSSCKGSNNSTLYINSIKTEGEEKMVNSRVCYSCISNSKEETENKFKNQNVIVAIRNISISANVEDLALPDLSIVNEISSSMENKEKHTIQCQDCTKLISEEKAYIVADELGNNDNTKVTAFCETCYKTTCYFEVPKFVYCVKYAIDYQNLLPKIDSFALLKFNVNSKLRFKDFSCLNDKSFKDFKEQNKESIDIINKQFEEIRNDHIIEYLKISDVDEKEKKSLVEEAKKNSLLETLSKSQLDIIEILAKKLDESINYVRDFIDMKYNNIVKEIYCSNLCYLSKKSRNDIFDRALYEGASDVSADSYNLSISRGKALKFKQKSNIDYQGNYTIFGQIFKQVKTMPLTQFNCKKNNRLFRVNLVGEGAIDAGGPYREIVNILCDELQSHWLDLFIPTPNNKFSAGQDREKWTINPAAKSATHLEMYTVIGKLFGFAIRSTGFLNLNLPSYVWKQLLDLPLELSDIEKIDIHTANFLEDLMNLEAKGIDEEQFGYLYDQMFTTILTNGKEVELQSGGKDKKLTFSNAKEYVSLALMTRFEESKVQIEAIKSGLYDVIKKDIALVLNWKDLEERVCGNLIVDVEWLKENTSYESWEKTDNVITWFWQAFSKFNNDERILYLKFVWGRSRLPLTKDSFTQKHAIHKSWSNHPDISLPLSHTCFFTIDIPPYSTYDILYNKILYAIRFCGEIDNDNQASQALEDI